MKTITFNIDYQFCPEGHGDWIFIPSSTLHSDIWWCKECDCFYEPSVKKIKYGVINKNYNSDREDDLKKRAIFLKWKNGLSYKDMPKN